MLSRLKDLDEKVFFLINGNWSEWIDPIMLFLSAKWVWIPLYLLIIFQVLKKFDRRFLWMLAALILVVVFADQVTSSFMKPFFERWRPCRDPLISDSVRIVSKCGGRYGFASSHAANTMGLAVLSMLLLKNRWTIWLVAWAILVGYSRIYLGVHYPGDVLAGYIVGLVGAYLIYLVFRGLKPF